MVHVNANTCFLLEALTDLQGQTHRTGYQYVSMTTVPSVHVPVVEELGEHAAMSADFRVLLLPALKLQDSKEHMDLPKCKTILSNNIVA